MKLIKGQEIFFNFHAIGLVSKTKCEVVGIHEGILTVSEGDPRYKFDLKTGKCVNDNNTYGAYRTLPKEFLNSELK